MVGLGAALTELPSWVKAASRAPTASAGHRWEGNLRTAKPQADCSLCGSPRPPGCPACRKQINSGPAQVSDHRALSCPPLPALPHPRYTQTWQVLR